MIRRRLAAAVALAALPAVPGAASGTQAADQALVRVAHFAPGLLKGDVYVVYVNGRLQLKGVPFKTVSDYLKVAPGKFKVEVRKAGSGEVLAKADNLKLASGIGEKLELLDIPDAAAAVSAAGGVATGAGGTSPSPSPGGQRFALFLLVGGGLAAAAGFVVQQRRSTG
jgi:Domain of unknown function (DUF4397)